MSATPPDERQPHAPDRALPPEGGGKRRGVGEYLRSHTVQAWSTFVVTALGVALTGIGVVVALGQRESDDSPGGGIASPDMKIAFTAGEEPGTSGTTDEEPHLSGNSPGETDRAADSSPCVDATSGESINCSAVSAALLVPLGNCDEDELFANWGVDANLDSILVQVRDVGGECFAVPTEVALAAGARASDLLAISSGTINPALRECARSGGTTLVSCVDPHELEWVGPWREEGLAAAGDTCLRDAKTYANNALVGTSPLTVKWLIAERPDGSQLFRCVLNAPGQVLQDTVRDIGTDPLPLVP